MEATNPTNPQSMNLYAYVENNPVDFTDPSGLLMREPDNVLGTVNVKDTGDSSMISAGLMSLLWSIMFRPLLDLPSYDDGGIYEVVNVVYDSNNQDVLTPEQVRTGVYEKYGENISKCTSIFGKDYKKLGAKRTETIKNAPQLDVTKTQAELSKITGIEGTFGTLKVPIVGNGTIYLQKEGFNEAKQSSYMRDFLDRAYIHELGNILSKRISGSFYKYGYKDGIGRDKDKDSGAKFEECVFGNTIP